MRCSELPFFSLFFISKGPPSSVDGWGHLSRVCLYSAESFFKTTFCLIKKEVEWRSQSLCPYLKSLATCPRIIFEVGEFMLEHSTLGQITTCLEVVVFGLPGLQNKMSMVYVQTT